MASLLEVWAWLESARPGAGLVAYQQTSTGLARWEAALGAVTTFREAARLLADLAGVEVGSETLRTQAERIGTELEGQQRASMAEVEQTHEPPAGEHAPAPGLLVIETDGVMVRYRDRHLDRTPVEGDWHEVKAGLAGGWQPGGWGSRVTGVVYCNSVWIHRGDCHRTARAWLLQHERNRMQYPVIRERHLPIGSGAAEQQDHLGMAVGLRRHAGAPPRSHPCRTPGGVRNR